MISSSLRENSAPRPVWGRARPGPRQARFWLARVDEFHSCRNRRPINSGFQPLGEFSPAKRLFPFRARVGEGHEFHSCRNRRPINSGFQPLGEFCPAKRLFPFRAGSGEGHEFHSCRNRRSINGGFQPLGECCPAKRLFPLRARVGEGHDSQRLRKNSVSRPVWGRARVPLVP